MYVLKREEFDSVFSIDFILNLLSNTENLEKHCVKVSLSCKSFLIIFAVIPQQNIHMHNSRVFPYFSSSMVIPFPSESCCALETLLRLDYIFCADYRFSVYATVVECTRLMKHTAGDIIITIYSILYHILSFLFCLLRTANVVNQ